MTIEGLWELKARHHEDPYRYVPGGILVLERGRIFGGDSAVTFVGTYDAVDGRMTASGRAWTWNPEMNDAENVFGMIGPIDMLWGFDGVFGADGRINGFHFPAATPELRLPVVASRMTDLPPERAIDDRPRIGER